MKPWLKILIIGIITLTLLYSATYVFIIFKGRTIIINTLKELTNKKVSMGYFDVTPPLNLDIKNLNIEGLAKVENIFISPSIPYLLSGNIALNKVIILRPEITLERNPSKIVDSNATVETTSTATIADIKRTATAFLIPQESNQRRALRLILKRLDIKDGKINFLDHTVNPEGIKIIAKDLNFTLINLYTFPFSTITNFELKGKIPWKEGQEEGKIEAEGWMNFFKKDMQAALKIKDIDGVYLYPYYSNWVDLEKARIEKASLNFTSNIHGLNNDITAESRLELTNIVRKPRSPDETQEKAEKITDAVLDIFKALNQGKIVLDFTLHTKMDRPEFSFGPIKMAFEDKLAQARSGSGMKPEGVLILPAKLLEGAVKSATEVSKAVINGTFAVGNEFKKAIEDSFKKRPAPAPTEKK